MQNKSNEIQLWFLRHGKTPFDYENSEYDDFIEMLCNGHGTPLAENPEIEFESLPKQVDLVCYAPAKRAVETANVIRNEINVKQMEELELIREVRFDNKIIRKPEFKSLDQNRPDILERWYKNQNGAESFEKSYARVKQIDEFIKKKPENTIILVTHGWFLRLLEIYFVEGKRKQSDISLEDILKVKPVPLGHCIKATVERERSVESRTVILEPTY